MGFPWGNPVSQVHKNDPPSPFQQDAFAPHGSLEQEFSSSVSSSAFSSSRDEFESVFSSSNSSSSVWLSSTLNISSFSSILVSTSQGEKVEMGVEAPTLHQLLPEVGRLTN